MAIAPASFGFERRNPLPVGRYWTMRQGAEDIAAFDVWLSVHRKMKALRVVASDFDKGGPFLKTNPPSAFVVFEVLVPNVVVWQGPGLPDKSPPHVTSRSDVEKGPVILEPAERAADAVASAVTRGSESFTTLLFVAAVVFLLAKKD